MSAGAALPTSRRSLMAPFTTPAGRRLGPRSLRCGRLSRDGRGGGAPRWLALPERGARSKGYPQQHEGQPDPGRGAPTAPFLSGTGLTSRRSSPSRGARGLRTCPPLARCRPLSSRAGMGASMPAGWGGAGAGPGGGDVTHRISNEALPPAVAIVRLCTRREPPSYPPAPAPQVAPCRRSPQRLRPARTGAAPSSAPASCSRPLPAAPRPPSNPRHRSPHRRLRPLPRHLPRRRLSPLPP